MPVQSVTNKDIADLLEQIAGQLERHGDNLYRIEAFRGGAKSVRASQTPLAEIVEKEGGEALKQIEGIGQGLAMTIFEFIQTGRSGYLQQLQTSQSPEELFQPIPGIGKRLARRIALQLKITSLEELEQAARDGRLQQVYGVGPKRIAIVCRSLAEILPRLTRQPQQTIESEIRPAVSLLLAVDAEYRRCVVAGQLPKLAPRQFNPTHEAWLPIMCTKRAGWSMTALFSNTARAHELDKTRDWVVIYYQKDGPEAQCTVVTEFQGPLKGQRVIRGRESECKHFYQAHQGQTKNGGYGRNLFARMPEDELIEDELAGSWWVCPNCGHHTYTVKNSYESDFGHEDLGVATVLVCACCGYTA